MWLTCYWNVTHESIEDKDSGLRIITKLETKKPEKQNPNIHMMMPTQKVNI
jgi:hypothetical protein